MQASDGSKPPGIALAVQMPSQQASRQEALQHAFLRHGVRQATNSHLQPLLCTAKPLQEKSDSQDRWASHCLLGDTDQDQMSSETV